MGLNMGMGTADGYQEPGHFLNWIVVMSAKLLKLTEAYYTRKRGTFILWEVCLSEATEQ